MPLRRLVFAAVLLAGPAGADETPEARLWMRMLCEGTGPGGSAFAMVVQQAPGMLDASWFVPGGSNYGKPVPTVVPLDLQIFLEAPSDLPQEPYAAARDLRQRRPDRVTRADGYRRDATLTAAWSGEAGWLEVTDGAGVFRDAALGLAIELRCAGPWAVPGD
ncbi:hypothetical protein P1J78_06715 [Psychromarinibacter sp. C21-152]|uniref:Uncharacterized protein n=1 Tax=Psychromarinibacter sediminicola TaxID=3033385 RepID=A0AAE3NQW3_9RHOB|nr:hypothetical protein [Psychromarinibacter sediminicola]MDF0600416.1 hypothetical protein [Psychromarinibacter sediminicola]